MLVDAQVKLRFCRILKRHVHTSRFRRDGQFRQIRDQLLRGLSPPAGP
jgi:hypothetical protein